MTSVYVFGVIIAMLFISGLVVAPLLEDEPADPNEPDGDASPEERREAALDALEELQFEHETGKLSDDDYRRLKDRYARAAVDARHEHERGAGGAAAEPARAVGEAAGEGAAAPGESSTAPEAGVAHCPECGAEAAAGARFCRRCGSELPT